MKNNINLIIMKTKTLAALLLAAASLAACVKTEVTQPSSDPSLVSFSAGIRTRAYDTSWESGDMIGISGTSFDKDYTNVAYVTSSEEGGILGAFTVANEGEEIYYQDNNEVTFTAYYPWKDLQGATSITADSRVQSQRKTFDFLWAQATGSKATPEVVFNFAHSMAKLVLTIKKGADVSYAEVKEALISLSGVTTDGTFNVTTGVAAAESTASVQTWCFANNTTETTYNTEQVPNNDETVSYTLILFPQAFSAGSPSVTAELTGRQSFTAHLDFTAANTAAGDANATNSWVAGRQYNLSVTLHKTSLEVGECTITGWDEENAGNVDAM